MKDELKEMMERTLIVLKPDAVCRGIMGKVISRFEDAGFTIVAASMVQPSEDFFKKHYEDIGKVLSRMNEQVFTEVITFMVQSPVFALVVEGVNAVERVRKMVGKTEPFSAEPGTIRGDFAHVTYAYGDTSHLGVANVVHASGNKEEAALEVALWFDESEIFDYDRFGRHLLG